MFNHGHISTDETKPDQYDMDTEQDYHCGVWLRIVSYHLKKPITWLMQPYTKISQSDYTTE